MAARLYARLVTGYANNVYCTAEWVTDLLLIATWLPKWRSSFQIKRRRLKWKRKKCGSAQGRHLLCVGSLNVAMTKNTT